MNKNLIIALLVIAVLVAIAFISNQPEYVQESTHDSISVVEIDEQSSENAAETSEIDLVSEQVVDLEVQSQTPTPVGDASGNIELESNRSYCDCSGTLTVCPGSVSNVDCQSCCSTYHPGGDAGVE